MSLQEGNVIRRKSIFFPEPIRYFKTSIYYYDKKKTRTFGYSLHKILKILPFHWVQKKKKKKGESFGAMENISYFSKRKLFLLKHYWILLFFSHQSVKR